MNATLFSGKWVELDPNGRIPDAPTFITYRDYCRDHIEDIMWNDKPTPSYFFNNICTKIMFVRAEDELLFKLRFGL